MAINKYKDSFFSKVFSLFDTEVVGWTENIYNKIKVDGVLPKYISREKEIRKVDLVTFTNSSITEDDRFIWGYKKKPTNTYSYQLSSYVDIGTVHTIEFEIESNSAASGYIMSGYSEVILSTSGDTTITYKPIFSGAGVDFTFTLDTNYHICKITRNNNSLSIFIDNAFIETKNLPTNENLPFQFNRLSGGNFSTGQVKIFNGDKILHWWKAVSISDEGNNSIDFYTIWNTICHIFAILYKYSSYLTKVNSYPELVKKFLVSKSINFANSSSDSELITLYNRWNDEYVNRGVNLISKSGVEVRGICLRFTNQDYGFSVNDSTIPLGNQYTVEFDWKYDSNIGLLGQYGTIIKGINCNTLGSNQNLVEVSNVDATHISMSFYGGITTATIFKDTILHKIKISRYIHNYWVYFDGELLTSSDQLIVTSDNISQGNGVVDYPTLIKGCIGRIANLKISGVGYNFIIKLNTVAYTLYESVTSYYNIAYYGNVNAPSLSNLFMIDEDFKNVLGGEIDGELLRLIDKQSSDEFILAYNSSIGWTLNTSSPTQKQTYPICGFNKYVDLYTKGVISKLPISYGGVTKEYFNTIKVKEVIHSKTNPVVGSLDYKKYWNIEIRPDTISGTPKKYGISPIANIQYNISDYLIPISDNEDYEISFRITLSDPDLNIKFRPICYDATMNELPPISAKDGSISDISFVDVAYGDTDMATFIGRIIFTNRNSAWIRGVLHKKNFLVGEDTNGLNQNLSIGRNLIMAEGTTFIIPEILIESNANNLTQIYDIQVRPTTSNIDKGQLNTKNLFSLYCMNRSNSSIQTISNIIDNDLIPVDSFVKVKELNIDNPFIDLNNYGYLYNSYAVETGNLAPTDWHVPTRDEWNTLITYIGGSSVAGGKLKELGTDNWDTPNTGATDQYEFTALPNGARNYLGTFVQRGAQGMFLTSTLILPNVYNVTMFYSNISMTVGSLNRKTGLSIRCIKNSSDWVEGETVTDIDGNVYKTVKIGDQVWMASNLRTTHYNNNILIPEVTPNLDWAALTTGAWCTYNNETVNKDILSWDDSSPISWDNREVIEYQ